MSFSNWNPTWGVNAGFGGVGPSGVYGGIGSWRPGGSSYLIQGTGVGPGGLGGFTSRGWVTR